MNAYLNVIRTIFLGINTLPFGHLSKRGQLTKQPIVINNGLLQYDA